MRFLWAFIVLTSLLIRQSIAVSNHANAILGHMSTISDAVKANDDAINRYNGGMVAAIPVGQRSYDSWNALRGANANMTHGELSPEDSDVVMKKLNSLNQAAISTLTAHKDKANVFYNAKLSFVAPILLQAIHHESQSYKNAIKKQVPEKYAPSFEEMTAKYNDAWNAAFTEFASAHGNGSALPQSYKGFESVLTPFLHYLP